MLGYSLSISGDGQRVAVGIPRKDINSDPSGHVKVFEYRGGNWELLGSPITGNNGDEARFGKSVSLSFDGSVVACGSIDNESGFVRVFSLERDQWRQLGDDINGESSNDSFGKAVSLAADGQTVVIGGPNNDGNGVDSGHVRVYKYVRKGWTQMGNDVDGSSQDDFSGNAVSISANGTVIAVAAVGYNGENKLLPGYVRIFTHWNAFDLETRNPVAFWRQLGDDIQGTNTEERFGRSVSLSADGKMVAVGAGGGAGNDSGTVRIFSYDANGVWTQAGQNIDGKAVSLSADGSRVAVGAPRGDNDSGYVHVYDAQIN